MGEILDEVGFTRILHALQQNQFYWIEAPHVAELAHGKLNLTFSLERNFLFLTGL